MRPHSALGCATPKTTGDKYGQQGQVPFAFHRFGIRSFNGCDGLIRQEPIPESNAHFLHTLHSAYTWRFSHLQQREEHWAIIDLIGKASHIRTIPMPDWVKVLVDDWLHSARISSGKIFRRVTRAGTVWGSGLTEKVVWHVVRQ